MRTNLEDGTSNFKIFFLLTLTGTSLDNTFSDFDEYQGLLKENQAVQRTNVSLIDSDIFICKDLGGHFSQSFDIFRHLSELYTYVKKKYKIIMVSLYCFAYFLIVK